jgi:hypothetical protein
MATATGATGSTGYKFMHNGSLKDFYEVFRPGNAGITTGFTVANGTDLVTLFEGGDDSITTGYKNLLNTDLGRLFAQVTPFIATNATITGSAYPYYYAIFTDTSVTGIIRPSSNYNYPANFKLNFICVGGGGGGGGSNLGVSCGGGGGGGVHIINIDYDNASVNYRVTVGEGGSGGPATISGSPGGYSEIAYRYIDGFNFTKFIVRCTGGGQGTTSAAGSGGVVYLNDNTNTPIAEGNGGNGGDETNGTNCYYHANTLADSGTNVNIITPPPPTPNDSVELKVGQQLIDANPTYISNYYSGGGGGSKGNNNMFTYSPGQGGGTLGGVSPTLTNTGFGGARGNEGNPADNIWSGRPGNGYGSGGGAGGYKSDGTRYAGGAGKQGIVIAFSFFNYP